MKKYDIPVGSLEKVTKDKIKQFFIDNKIWYKMPQPGVYGANNGTSDFQALHKGVFIAIEAKRNSPTAKITQQQLDYLEKVRVNGGYSQVISCTEDLIEFESWLRSRDLI